MDALICWHAHACSDTLSTRDGNLWWARVWMTYRRSLPLFSSFWLSSRLICWDERWFYLEQTFTGHRGLAAMGWVKGNLRDENGNVKPQQVLERVAPGIVSPPMPEAIAVWNELTREKLLGGTSII